MSIVRSLQHKWKKRSEATQAPRAGFSKAESKNFAPPQTPFSGAQDGQNLISWRWSLPSSTNPVWWRSMHAISSYRGNRPTNEQTNPQTHTHTHTHKQTGPITIHCAAKLSAQCNEAPLILSVVCFVNKRGKRCLTLLLRWFTAQPCIAIHCNTLNVTTDDVTTS